MEIINQIAEIIAEELQITTKAIAMQRGPQGRQGSQILCYIIKHDHVGLNRELAQYIRKSTHQCNLIYKNIEDAMMCGEPVLEVMNRVREQLRLAPIYPSIQSCRDKEQLLQRREQSRKNAKRLFFIQYTDSDEQAMKKAMEESVIFFRKYGKGRKPKFVGEC